MKQRIALDNGKYTFVLEDDDCTLNCLRHGKPWREFVGDNAVHSLFYYAVEKDAEITALKERDVAQANEILRLSGLLRVSNTERNDLKERVRELEAEISNPQKTYCAYCGFVVEIDDEGASKIGEHIVSCGKHPMRIPEAENKRLREVLEKITPVCDISPSCVNCGEYEAMCDTVKIARGVNDISELITDEEATDES